MEFLDAVIEEVGSFVASLFAPSLPVEIRRRFRIGLNDSAYVGFRFEGEVLLWFYARGEFSQALRLPVGQGDFGPCASWKNARILGDAILFHYSSRRYERVLLREFARDMILRMPADGFRLDVEAVAAWLVAFERRRSGTEKTEEIS